MGKSIKDLFFVNENKDNGGQPQVVAESTQVKKEVFTTILDANH